ncbi:hypothetical protein FNH22_15320 [Fulvivirga sp. M361]|uniref:hypothetical protein n=1 Tax=Fulvivirga sp. M361 TaxID=2594266 RepID=UPI001179F9D8|nr:hypothetical protein [Fulvivirga sp. M361]TRX57776.1 hypothetical protein FNH22_15320 [Fulvivirga sp. M361]
MPEPSNDLQPLKTILTAEINRMLDEDLGSLLNALYRIDIGETLVTQVLAEENLSDIAPKLSDMIIARELLKIKLRTEYDQNTL